MHEVLTEAEISAIVLQHMAREKGHGRGLQLHQRMHAQQDSKPHSYPEELVDYLGFFTWSCDPQTQKEFSRRLRLLTTEEMRTICQSRLREAGDSRSFPEYPVAQEGAAPLRGC